MQFPVGIHNLKMSLPVVQQNYSRFLWVLRTVYAHLPNRQGPEHIIFLPHVDH